MMVKLIFRHVNIYSFEYNIEECRKCFELGVRSKFDQAIEQLGKCSSFSIYHASTQMCLSAIKQMLTLNKVKFFKYFKYFILHITLH